MEIIWDLLSFGREKAGDLVHAAARVLVRKKLKAAIELAVCQILVLAMVALVFWIFQDYFSKDSVNPDLNYSLFTMRLTSLLVWAIIIGNGLRLYGLIKLGRRLQWWWQKLPVKILAWSLEIKPAKVVVSANCVGLFAVLAFVSIIRSRLCGNFELISPWLREPNLVTYVGYLWDWLMS
jgi:hypothetical protein